MTADAFASVFGSGRGQVHAHGLGAERLSSSEVKQMRALTLQARKGDISAALEVLTAHREFIGARPRLQKLAGAVGQGAALKTIRDRRFDARAVMSTSGAHSRFAAHLALGTNPLLPTGGALHIWADGDKYAHPSDVRESDDGSLTLCGVSIPELRAAAVTRGTWRKRKTSSGQRTGQPCEQCAKSADLFWECEETQQSASALPPDASGQLADTLTEALTSQARTGRAPTAEDFYKQATQHHDRLLAGHAARLYAANPELTLRRMGDPQELARMSGVADRQWECLSSAEFGEIVEETLEALRSGRVMSNDLLRAWFSSLICRRIKDSAQKL